MIWYHGTTWSNAESVVKNGIIPNWNIITLKDFGPAFYLTSNRAQAIRWARLTSFRHRKTVMAQEDVIPALLKIKIKTAVLLTTRSQEFAYADERWAREILINRTSLSNSRKFEVEYGPVADGRINRALLRYQQSQNLQAFRAAISNSLFDQQYDQLAVISSRICSQLDIVSVQKLGKGDF